MRTPVAVLPDIITAMKMRIPEGRTAGVEKSAFRNASRNKM